jgi:hypothetical protein
MTTALIILSSLSILLSLIALIAIAIFILGFSAKLSGVEDFVLSAATEAQKNFLVIEDNFQKTDRNFAKVRTDQQQHLDLLTVITDKVNEHSLALMKDSEIYHA